MPPSKIMIIRHAEKPTGEARGISGKGRRDRHGLTPRGWQRAGALARYFAPLDGHFAFKGLARPGHLHAARPDKKADEPSKRERDTLKPLSLMLDLPIVDHCRAGQEARLVEEIEALDGIVLIAWDHARIHAIVAALGAPPTPVWPDDRFDVTLALDRGKKGWSATQIPQMLLAGDRSDPLWGNRQSAASPL